MLETKRFPDPTGAWGRLVGPEAPRIDATPRSRRSSLPLHVAVTGGVNALPVTVAPLF